MSYNNIIWTLGRTGRLDAAELVFTELCAHKYLRPNVYTYGALLYGLARGKLYQEALYYLEDMQRRGVPANHVVLSSAMEACASAGKYEEALRVLDRAKAMSLKPDVTMVNIAIKACAQAGAMAEATQLAE
jgi:pentatricopeptide repeat protein